MKVHRRALNLFLAGVYGNFPGRGDMKTVSKDEQKLASRKVGRTEAS